MIRVYNINSYCLKFYIWLGSVLWQYGCRSYVIEIETISISQRNVIKKITFLWSLRISYRLNHICQAKNVSLAARNYSEIQVVWAVYYLSRSGPATQQERPGIAVHANARHILDLEHHGIGLILESHYGLVNRHSGHLATRISTLLWTIAPQSLTEAGFINLTHGPLSHDTSLQYWHSSPLWVKPPTQCLSSRILKNTAVILHGHIGLELFLQMFS